jgi:DNA-binding CsgD family transcriptional regulator
MSRRQQSVQAVAAPTQVAHRETESADLLRDLLTTVEAAERLKYSGPSAVKNFLKWADRQRVPRLHRGRICLWQPSVLAAFLRRDKWTRNRHTSTVTPLTLAGKGDAS